MTAFALPSFRRRKSKPQQVAETAVKVWTAMKVGSAVAGTAKKGAKAYGKFKVFKVVGKRGAKLLVIPIAAGGGFAAYKKLSSSSDEPATPYGSSVGPVATPATVTPPKTSPGSATNGEGTLSDPPAGTANPPAPPSSAS
jgi:hypothetical protein